MSGGERLTGAILAGGRSRRLGRDKVTLPLAGRPLALWAAAAIGPWVQESWLVTNQPLAHLSLGLPLITDLKSGQGPLGGLETALFYARTPMVLAVAADTPFLAAPLLATLAGRAAAGVKTALVCRTERGLQPFPGLYTVRLLPRLTAFLNGEDRYVRHFLEQCRVQTLDPPEVARLDPRGLSFMNLNTPEDLAVAVSLAQEIPGLSPSS